jgi:hypothetical protein
MPSSWRPRQSSAVFGVRLFAFMIACFAISSPIFAQADKSSSGQQLQTRFSKHALPLLKSLCLDCHSSEKSEGELDLERFSSLAELRKAPDVWSKVIEMLENGEMPPKEARPQPTAEERKALRTFAEDFLHAEALANAGDPGPVVLRRLTNAEYTYVIRDLTGAPLSPAKEFPVDGAAGEGFTNAGAGLVMSPALLEKYLDAGKRVAAHAVLLPSGFRFSPSANHQDHVNEILDQIRTLYRSNSDSVGASQVNLQGIVFDTNDGGRLAVEKYIRATVLQRARLSKGGEEIAKVAKEHSLNPKYLGILFQALNSDSPSRLLSPIRGKWRTATEKEVASLTAEIDAWRASLWKFSSVGHIGKKDGPTAWQEPVSPLLATSELRFGFDPANLSEVTMLYLSASDAGDGNDGDYLLLNEPKFVAAGKPDLLLRDLRAICDTRVAQRTRLLAQTEQCLAAAAEAMEADSPNLAALAKKHGAEVEIMTAWFAYLGIDGGRQQAIESPLKGKLEKGGGWDFVNGWGSPETPSALANSSDMHVRVPANLPGKSVLVHPSPTLNIVTTYKSPKTVAVAISASVRHAHPECGNGVTWSLEIRHGNSRRVLSTGIAHGDRVHALGPFEAVRLSKGDLVSLVIGPRDANHSCDSTLIDLQVSSADQKWGLASDVSPNILAANPHADQFGNPDVWCFHTEPVGATSGYAIPEGSLLASWQTSTIRAERNTLAMRIAAMAASKVAPAAETADGKLYRQLTSLGGPLVSSLPPTTTISSAGNSDSTWGLDPALFGSAPQITAIQTNPVAPTSLAITAPAVLEMRIPTDLIAGREFVAQASLIPSTAGQGSVQAQVSLQKPPDEQSVAPGVPKELNADSSWTTRSRQVVHSAPILVQADSQAEKEWAKALEEFRSLFPQALCYTKIVPVDEVVTLTLYYREDEMLQRLMLSEPQVAELNRLWEELHFVARDALTLVDALEQLLEYASQDGDPKVFEPLRAPTLKRAEEFKAALLAAEPHQLNQLCDFASQVYRRPLASDETKSLRGLYKTLRQEGLPHDEAIRFLIARLLAAPAFLYKLESAPSGDKSAPVTPTALASRLSFFLWSTLPDQELLQAATSGELTKDAVLRQQTARMLKDARVRRLATEFACQWLHIYEFDQHDEKSEKHFPEFATLRSDMHEEAIAFFTDLFQRDGSILEALKADHTFVNDRLGAFYGVSAAASDAHWRRVENAKALGRGGVLGMAATLSKQSGASRTSPILRGNWVSEVLLGERLPRPPKDVPQLPEEESTDGLSVRQLIEKHSSDARCATCHIKIDAFGFALEGYDAIGRKREADIANRPIDVKTVSPDGVPMEGIEGLREYLLTTRREAFVKQFCKKLLGYALGRGVQLSDEPLIAHMMDSLAKHDYRFSAALEPIVLSKQFREIRGRDATFAEAH